MLWLNAWSFVNLGQLSVTAFDALRSPLLSYSNLAIVLGCSSIITPLWPNSQSIHKWIPLVASLLHTSVVWVHYSFSGNWLWFWVGTLGELQITGIPSAGKDDFTTFPPALVGGFPNTSQYILFHLFCHYKSSPLICPCGDSGDFCGSGISVMSSQIALVILANLVSPESCRWCL